MRCKSRVLVDIAKLTLSSESVLGAPPLKNLSYLVSVEGESEGELKVFEVERIGNAPKMNWLL